MKTIWEKRNQWLQSMVLILFVLAIITLPFVMGITYSGRSEAPNHVLTYTEGQLTWDSATNVNANGVAELSLFDAVYPNVQSQDGRNVVAPGTEGFSIVRLKNSVEGDVKYTAVLYRIYNNEELPVKADLNTEGHTTAASYSLPQGVEESQVIRAVEGTVRGGEIKDFDISWLWAYSESSDQDAVDTLMGIQGDANQVTVGLYVVVEDDNSYVTPSDPTEPSKPSDPTDPTKPSDPAKPSDPTKPTEPAKPNDPSLPQTGDTNPIGIYLILMGISAIVLILLLIVRRREKECT